VNKTGQLDVLPTGRIWVSTHDDILCFDGERFFSLREAGFPPVLGSLAEDDEGAILSATSMGIYAFMGGVWSAFSPERASPK
jgi:hypothetical protein